MIGPGASPTHPIGLAAMIAISDGRFSGHGLPALWIAADIIHFEDGKLAEHWGTFQIESRAQMAMLPRLNPRSSRWARQDSNLRPNCCEGAVQFGD
jgi:hypothetical protein